MAQTRYVLTLERVAEILDEDLELIAAIVANDDNLSCGCIVYVEMAAGNDSIKALTVDDVEELGQMLADARSSQQEWDIFLTGFVADPEIFARVKPKQPR
nr:hypothetical protein [uncultured Cohaesibacter sp.]